MRIQNEHLANQILKQEQTREVSGGKSSDDFCDFASSDSYEMSSVGSLVGQWTELSQMRVQQLRGQYQAGNYKPDPAQISSKLIVSMLAD
jgi:anti-sigma28 factor (negative regulator of flagellin synthesis)